MTEEQLKTAARFSSKIYKALQETVFNEESEHYADLENEFNKDKDATKLFLYALSTVVPCNITEQFLEKEFNFMEFNEFAKVLLIYCSPKEESNESDKP